MEEILAVSFCQKNAGKRFRYTGPEDLREKEGSFEILEDCNCCAPTQNVLFAFVCDSSRKVMSAEQLLEFIKYTEEV